MAPENAACKRAPYSECTGGPLAELIARVTSARNSSWAADSRDSEADCRRIFKGLQQTTPRSAGEFAHLVL